MSVENIKSSCWPWKTEKVMRMLSDFIPCMCPTPKYISLDISPKKRLMGLFMGFTVLIHLYLWLCAVSWNSPIAFVKGGSRVNFRNSCKKGGGGAGSDFFMKRGVGKIGGFPWKKPVSPIFILTLCVIFLSLCCVGGVLCCAVVMWCSVLWCGVCVCVPFLSAFCASHEELSLMKSNQQIYNLYESVIFEKQRHCGPL